MKQEIRSDKLLMVLAGALLLVAILLSQVEYAYAATWSKMASDTPIPPSTQVIPLNYKAGATEITYNTSAYPCLLYTSPSPRDRQKSRMPSSA